LAAAWLHSFIDPNTPEDMCWCPQEQAADEAVGTPSMPAMVMPPEVCMQLMAASVLLH
jgi:hypothetical protein